jgi:hypothetical protein
MGVGASAFGKNLEALVRGDAIFRFFVAAGLLLGSIDRLIF